MSADPRPHRIREPYKWIVRYGARFAPRSSDIDIELACIRKDGQWTGASGQPCGLGLAHHFRQLDRLLWPADVYDEWDAKMDAQLIQGGIVGIVGPTSSGKSNRAAKFALRLYCAFPDECTVLVSTTTRESLEYRIWGEIKKYYNLAKRRYPDFPGYMLESAQQLSSATKEVEEARDLRSGIKGVPCYKGDKWVGLGSFVGVKNKTVFVVADEAHLMPPGYFDSAANLAGNSTRRPFTLAALGNPKDPTDALGNLCEPRCGWDQLLQGDGDQLWESRVGRVLRLDGTCAPNLALGPGREPCKEKIRWSYLQLVEDHYGKGSWQWEMFVRARFPVNVMERRLFVRKFAERFRAFEEPEWADAPLTHLYAVDAAYGAVGGDRCVGGHFRFGLCTDGKYRLALRGGSVLIPVLAAGSEASPEDQIATYVRDYCVKEDIDPSHVFFDSTGRGSLVAAFYRLWSVKVVGVEFGGPASERPDPQNPENADRTCRQAYSKFVSELCFALRACIEADQFRGLTLDVAKEAEMRAWDLVGKPAKQEIESKEEMRKRLKRSPDLLDMVCVGVEGARQLGFQIARLGRGPARGTAEGHGRALREMADRWKAARARKQLVYA